MIIRDILHEKGSGVVTVLANETIHAAILKLNEHNIGALVVTDKQGEIAGIVTERDILKCCGRSCGRLESRSEPDEKACQYHVDDIMTKDLVIGVPDDDLNYAMGIMTKNHIRHLPVLELGQLAGIISISDLVNAHFEEKVFENRTLKDYIRGWARRES